RAADASVTGVVGGGRGGGRVGVVPRGGPGGGRVLGHPGGRVRRVGRAVRDGRVLVRHPARPAPHRGDGAVRRDDREGRDRRRRRVLRRVRHPGAAQHGRRVRLRGRGQPAGRGRGRQRQGGDAGVRCPVGRRPAAVERRPTRG